MLCCMLSLLNCINGLGKIYFCTYSNRNFVSNWKQMKLDANKKLIMFLESYCFLGDTQHGGTALKGISSIGSATHCQFECQKYEGCLFFTYTNSNGNCSLYSAASPSSLTTRTSGPKFCISQDSKNKD